METSQASFFDESDTEHAQREFTGEDFSSRSWTGHGFFDCRFTGCDFSDADLSRSVWESCSFHDCNFSNTVVAHAKLMGVTFVGCKVLGVSFYKVHDLGFEIAMERCLVSLCHFSSLKMKSCRFEDSRVTECQFDNASLVEANFCGSDLAGSVFHGCDLQKADFRGARGYAIDPTANTIRKARFSSPDVLGLLSHLDIRIE